MGLWRAGRWDSSSLRVPCSRSVLHRHPRVPLRGKVTLGFVLQSQLPAPPTPALQKMRVNSTHSGLGPPAGSGGAYKTAHLITTLLRLKT